MELCDTGTRRQQNVLLHGLCRLLVTFRDRVGGVPSIDFLAWKPPPVSDCPSPPPPSPFPSSNPLLVVFMPTRPVVYVCVLLFLPFFFCRFSPKTAATLGTITPLRILVLTTALRRGGFRLHYQALTRAIWAWGWGAWGGSTRLRPTGWRLLGSCRRVYSCSICK